jgi:splicing factor 3A subunit 3
VTTIAEALALHKSLESKGTGSWDKEVDEEYEDADGNVYNKKTYDDLKRQGLI